MPTPRPILTPPTAKLLLLIGKTCCPSDVVFIKPAGWNGKIEYVRVSIDFDHSQPWSVGFRLQSPDGTVVNLMQPYTNLNYPNGAYYFDIGVAGLYGENMEGDWVLEVRDYVAGTTGVLERWGIQIYGN